MKFSVIILIFVLLTSSIFASSKEEVKITGLSGEERKLAKFIAGVELLEAERTISPEEKLAWFDKLSELTGIDSKRANVLIERFKNNPNKWAKILELASQEVKVKKEKEKEKKKEDKNE